MSLGWLNFRAAFEPSWAPIAGIRNVAAATIISDCVFIQNPPEFGRATRIYMTENEWNMNEAETSTGRTDWLSPQGKNGSAAMKPRKCCLCCRSAAIQGALYALRRSNGQWRGRVQRRCHPWFGSATYLPGRNGRRYRADPPWECRLQYPK